MARQSTSANSSANRAASLVRAGRPDEAARVYRDCLRSDPDQMAALTFLSMYSLEHGDLEHAEAYQRHAIRISPDSAVLQQNLGLILQARGRLQDALAAFDESVRLDPDAAHVWLHRAGVLHDLGRLEDAVSDCCRAGRLNPDVCRAHTRSDAPKLLQRVSRRAQQIVWEYEVGRERAAVAPLRASHPAEALKRIDKFLNVQHREQPPEFPHPMQRPSVYFFPGLSPRPFYEREEFPWIAELEAGLDSIVEELKRVLESRTGELVPYVPETGEPSQEGWDILAGSQDWSSFHLYKGGRRVDDNCEQCPRTTAILERMPLSRIQGHAPEAFFSILGPGAHIPPHFGISNFKLTLHLPLIVPGDCAIRAGDETREWREGECLIFDDSFEHEAWNRSECTRVVLITDIWQPELTDVERRAVQAVIKASDDFIGWCHGDAGRPAQAG